MNCGTGEDAINFANKKHTVIATDISEEMIGVAKAKKYPDNLEFQVQDINTISAETFHQKFDLIFSNFGGFNCLSNIQIQDFFKKAASLLNSKGKIILVVMPKNCLWERIYFSLKAALKKANRRNTTTFVLANVEGVNVKTWYYNPKEIVAFSKPLFIKNKVKPIGLAIPPSYLENSFLSKKPLISILKGIDVVFTTSFLANYADHFYIELQKR